MMYFQRASADQSCMGGEETYEHRRSVEEFQGMSD